MKIGFWLFMLVMALLVPAVMIAFGVVCKKNPPKKINSWYGYRTSRSMASQEAWDFAHQVCGRIWRRWGIVMLPVSVLLLLPVLGRDVSAVGIWACVLVTVQCVVLFATIFPVERALKENFDQYGHRIEKTTNGNEE